MATPPCMPMLPVSLEFDPCQNKVFADQYHVTILRAQALSSQRSAFVELTADQVPVFDWIAG